MIIKKAYGTAILNGNVVDSLEDNSSTNAPSQRAVNDALSNLFTLEPLYDGSMGNVGTNYTLSDDITNYDFLVVVGGAEDNYFRKTLIIPVMDITYSSTNLNSYAISTYTSDAYYYINFSFPTSTTIRTVDRSNSGWGTPRLNKVYGVKF